MKKNLLILLLVHQFSSNLWTQSNLIAGYPDTSELSGLGLTNFHTFKEFPRFSSLSLV